MATHTCVEWSLAIYSDGTDAKIGTSNLESRNHTLSESVKGKENDLTRVVHSHPTLPYASKTDMEFYKSVMKHSKLCNLLFEIFYVPEEVYINFNDTGTLYDSQFYEVQ